MACQHEDVRTTIESFRLSLVVTDREECMIVEIASCLIYARAFIEYVCGCVLFQDVTLREIRGR